MAEVEAFFDVSLMFALLISLFLVCVALLLPRMIAP